MITSTDKEHLETLAALVAKELASLLQPQKPWLNLREAATEYHIGEHRLVVLARAGDINGFQDPENKRKDWLFERQSLDRYRQNQIPVIDNPRKKALEILNSRRIGKVA